MKNVAAILPRVVGPFDDYCASSGLDPAGAYITTPLIATGVTPIECSHSGSDLLDRIIAFDRAEASFANITQTNMVTVSSFNGVNGIVLGYDFLKQDLRPHPLLDPENRHHVYDAEPLFQATRALYGTVEQKHFPIRPGQHLLCAYKTYHREGPCMIYGALGLAIAKDRGRNADLFMEDHGTIVATLDRASNQAQQYTVLNSLLVSIRRIGENLGVEYEKVFLGLKVKNIEPGEIGCVITAAPYIHLPKQAVPDGDPAALEHLTLAAWRERVRHSFQVNSSTPSVALGL